MSNTSQHTLRIVTPAELSLLGRASAILERVADRCDAAAWDRDATPRGLAPRPQDLGRLAEIATHGSSSLFEVVNVAKNYCYFELALVHFEAGETSWRDANPRGAESGAQYPDVHGHSVRA